MKKTSIYFLLVLLFLMSSSHLFGQETKIDNLEEEIKAKFFKGYEFEGTDEEQGMKREIWSKDFGATKKYYYKKENGDYYFSDCFYRHTDSCGVVTTTYAKEKDPNINYPEGIFVRHDYPNGNIEENVVSRYESYGVDLKKFSKAAPLHVGGMGRLYLPDGREATRDNAWYRIGDKQYHLQKDGNLQLGGQYVKTEDGEEKAFFVDPDHLISKLEQNEDKTIERLTFENGDQVVIKNGDQLITIGDEIIKGSLHVLGGQLIIDNTNMSPSDYTCKYKIYYTDGRCYQGTLKLKGDSYELLRSCSLQDYFNKDLCLYNGIMTYPDGHTDEYINGMSPDEIKKQRQEEEKERLAYEKSEKEAYNKLCAQFGKKYVDAAVAGTPIVGMPEALFVGRFKPTLSQERGNSRCYQVRGWGAYDSRSRTTLSNKILKYTVWVTNGKVSSVTHH